MIFLKVILIYFDNFLFHLQMSTDNPWNINSIYELQFFNCPSCFFKDISKQEIINHAYEVHPESIDFLDNIKDNSLSDIVCPWNLDVVKSEENDFQGIHPSMLEICIKTEDTGEDLIYPNKELQPKEINQNIRCDQCNKIFLCKFNSGSNLYISKDWERLI